MSQDTDPDERLVGELRALFGELDPVPPLDFQSDVPGPAFGAITKAIVKSGHGPAGNLT